MTAITWRLLQSARHEVERHPYGDGVVLKHLQCSHQSRFCMILSRGKDAAKSSDGTLIVYKQSVLLHPRATPEVLSDSRAQAALRKS